MIDACMHGFVFVGKSYFYGFIIWLSWASFQLDNTADGIDTAKARIF